MLFVCVQWLPLMLAGAQQQQVQGCSGSATMCGNISIADPFWLVDLKTGRSCGHRDFRVACLNNTPILRSNETLGFAIIQMNYTERNLRAIDLGKLNLLNSSNKCNSFPPTWNTSTKLSRPFRISNTNQNLILYNCTTEVVTAALRGDKELVQTGLRCGNQNPMLARMGGRYDETRDYGGYAVEGCQACIVPALGSSSSGEANTSYYEQLIRGGFLMTWDNPRRKFAPSNHLFKFFLPNQTTNYFNTR
jgi:hypothetical protein